MRLATYRPRQIYMDVPPLEQVDYEVGLEEFVRRFSEDFGNQVTFYQFGQIRSPGVSDIDLLLVVQDRDLRQASDIARSIVDSSARLGQLFAHEPLVVGESLVPCLPFLHTLEHCRCLGERWDPLAEAPAVVPDEVARLMRHAVWNSFVRITSLELEGGRIGLRRVLALMHNLLASAQQGNSFLSVPIPLSLSTGRIRGEVLAALPEDREAMVRDYVEQVLQALNEVDGRLDHELEDRLGYPLSSGPWALVVRQRIVVTSDLAAIGGGRWFDWLFRNVRVVPVPAYLIVLVTMLAQHLGKRDSHLTALRAVPLPVELSQQLNIAPFARCFGRALGMSESLGVKPMFPLPFSHREPRLPFRREIMWRVRSHVLSRRIHSLWAGENIVPGSPRVGGLAG
jgi:hypothetical protein